MNSSQISRVASGSDRLDRYISRLEVNAPYLRWQLEQFWAFLGNRILEVGCGIGGIIAQLGRRELIYGLDVDPEVLEYAAHRLTAQRECRFELLDISTCGTSDISRLSKMRFDTIICINALEHIRDDLSALQRMNDIVQPNGTLALLVPAHAGLFGNYDRLDGHFRRYDRRQLRCLAEKAGFRVASLCSFNALGAIGWWFQYRVLRRKEHGTGHFRAMNWCLPICRRLEGLAAPPFGLSLIAVLKKKETES